MPDPHPKQSWLTTLGWAAYLACSWTWCIGMFLPVLLVRDFGIWGFVVFAVPNVIGAGGMGWVLKSTESAERVLRGHTTAVRWFSIVTVAFQLFFLGWLNASNVSGSIAVAFLGLIIIVIISLVLSNKLRRGGIVPLFVWGISVALMAAAWSQGGLRAPDSTSGSAPSNAVIWLAPVCAMGFLLCPYLDATFLQARLNQSASSSRVSFTLGFGVLFSLMIAFTLFYSGSFGGALNPIQFRNPEGLAAAFIASHIGLQLWFTAVVHNQARQGLCGEMACFTRHKDHWNVFWLVALLVGSVIGRVNFASMNAGELIYRLFMSFYGLVFPAYVWLCMIPLKNEQGTQKPTREKLIVLAVAVALATPCYWMGFIERQTWWLAPGLGVVLLARPVLAFLVRRASPRRLA